MDCLSSLILKITNLNCNIETYSQKEPIEGMHENSSHITRMLIGQKAKHKILPTTMSIRTYLNNNFVIKPIFLSISVLIIMNITLINFLVSAHQRSNIHSDDKVELSLSKRSFLSFSERTTNFDSATITQEELLPDSVRQHIKSGYNDIESMSMKLDHLSKNSDGLATKFVFGKSVNDKSLIGFKLSMPNTSNQHPKRSLAILGSIHGDEPLGQELTLYLSTFLIHHYKLNNIRVKKLFENLDLYLIPTLNPDGFKKATVGDCFSARLETGRKNLNRVDLDEDFKFQDYHDLSSVLANNQLQPETRSLVEWVATEGKDVVFFVTLRTGLTGITYPYDQSPMWDDSKTSLASNACPDKDLFEYVGNEIYYANQTIKSKDCTLLRNNQTAVDGAQIGSIYGTLTDFLYRFTNMFPFNIYLDCCKYPNPTELEQKWLQHGNSLYALLERTNFGFRGVINDAETRRHISYANISIQSIDRNVTSRVMGDYWRPVTPGKKYEITVDAYGYKSAYMSDIFIDKDKSAQVLDFNLDPLLTSYKSKSVPSHYKYQSVTNHIKATPNKKQDSDSWIQSATSALKPNILFEDIDDVIEKLNFKSDMNIAHHHNHQELTTILQVLTKLYPEITRLYEIGKSVGGKSIYVLEISNQPGTHQLLKPEFRYVGNMHGNEVVGREMLIHLARLLLENYYTNDFVKALIDSTRIHLLFSLNPDGYERSEEGDCDSGIGRENRHNVDLNRNFPDRIEPATGELEPEVKAFMKWTKTYPFVLGANLHGGSLVANYPFDGNDNNKSGSYTKAPDDALFKHLAKAYSYNHPTMHKGEHCYDICGSDRESLLNEKFKDGITNGAKWYVLYGGIQDWVYLNSNCLTITVELGCMKYPLAKDLPTYWQYNKKALIKYILEIHRGIFGVVTDVNGSPIPNATIHVKDLDHDIHSSDTGDYWRILLPGEYLVSASKEGYRTSHRNVVVGKDKIAAVKINFSLNNGPKVLSDYQPIATDTSTKSSRLGDESSVANVGDISESVAIQNSKISSLQSQTLVPNKIAEKNTPSQFLGRISSFTDNSRYLFVLYAIVILPSILLLIYMFGFVDRKRYPHRFGFSRLATSPIDDCEEGFDETTRFVKNTPKDKFSNYDNKTTLSDSEDELYNAAQ